jgi:outer membrane receptor protein involved in Fe transport
MRLNHYLLIILSLFSSSIFAQNAKLTGKVTEESGDALISANVVIDASKGWAAVTDFDGNYEINIPAGSYEVSFRYIGKDEQKLKITLAAGEHRVLNVKMLEQQKLMNEVVVSGSKYEKKLSEETVTLDVMKGSDLANQNITSLDAGMTKVPGVTIADGQVNIRGGAGWSYGAGSRVQVMIDDLPLLTADAQDAKWDLIPMENLDQVEIIKGAASALYGSGALDGVVNARTAYPTDETYFKVTAYGGLLQSPTISPDMDWWGSKPRYGAGGNFAYREKFGQSDLVLGGSYNTSNGYLDSSGATDVRFNVKYRYRFKKIQGLNMGINASGYYSWGQTFFFYNGLDTAGYKPYPNTITTYKDYRITIDPFIDYYDTHDNQFKFLGRFFDATNTNNTGQGSSPITYYGELQYLKKFQTKGFDAHLVVGTVNDYKAVTPPASATNSLFGKNSEYDFSAYAQADFKFFKKLNVSIGARWEYITQWHYLPDTNQVTKQVTQKLDTVQNSLKQLPYPLFRLGLNYQVAEATYLRASIGQGFRYPSIAERYITTSVGPLGIYSNPNLNPEKGYSAEIAVRQGFKMGSWMGYGDLSAFWYRYNDMMEFSFGEFGNSYYFNPAHPGASAHDYGFGFASQNIGKTRILGAELELGTQGKIGPVGVQMMVSYTYIDPQSLNWNDTLVMYNYEGVALNSSKYLAPSAYNPAARDPEHPSAITYAMTSTSSKNILKYRSPHLFKADITLDWKGLQYNTNLQYSSYQQNIDYAFVSPLFRTIGPVAFNGLSQYRNMKQDIPIGKGRGDIVWNMSVAYAFKMGLRIGFLVNNVLNWEYTPRPAYFEAPRNYQLQLSYTFKGKKKDKSSTNK